MKNLFEKIAMTQAYYEKQQTTLSNLTRSHKFRFCYFLLLLRLRFTGRFYYKASSHKKHVLISLSIFKKIGPVGNQSLE